MPYNPDNNPWSRSRFKGLRWADQWGKPTRDWGIYGTRFMHTPTAEEEEAMANNSSLQAALMLAVAQAPDTQTAGGAVNKDGKPKESNSKSMGQEAGAPESSSSPSMGQEAGAPDSVIEDTNSRQNAALNDSTQSQNGGPEEYTQSVLSELKANPELLNQAQQSIDRGGAQGLNEYFNQRYPKVGGLKFLERSHPSAQVVVSMAERMDLGQGVERVLSKIKSLAQLHANPRLYKMAASSGAELFAASRSAMSMNPFEYGALNRPKWERVINDSVNSGLGETRPEIDFDRNRLVMWVKEDVALINSNSDLKTVLGGQKVIRLIDTPDGQYSEIFFWHKGEYHRGRVPVLSLNQQPVYHQYNYFLNFIDDAENVLYRAKQELGRKPAFANLFLKLKTGLLKIDKSKFSVKEFQDLIYHYLSGNAEGGISGNTVQALKTQKEAITFCVSEIIGNSTLLDQELMLVAINFEWLKHHGLDRMINAHQQRKSFKLENGSSFWLNAGGTGETISKTVEDARFEGAIEDLEIFGKLAEFGDASITPEGKWLKEFVQMPKERKEKIKYLIRVDGPSFRYKDQKFTGQDYVGLLATFGPIRFPALFQICVHEFATLQLSVQNYSVLSNFPDIHFNEDEAIELVRQILSYGNYSGDSASKHLFQNSILTSIFSLILIETALDLL